MNNLRFLRKEKGLTLNEVAEKLDITAMSLSRYERGAREPKGEFLIKISNFYNVSPDYILGWSEDKNKNVFTDEVLVSIYDELKELNNKQKEEILNVIKAIKKMK